LTSTTHWTHCYHSCHTKLSVISAVLKTSGLELVFIVKGFGLYWKHLDLNWCSLWKVLGFTESIWTWIGVHCERFWALLKASGLELVFIVKGFGLYWKHLDLKWCSLWKVLDCTETIWTLNRCSTSLWKVLGCT
jgi:hypothetical protein